jgi:ribosomal protein S18 acetylase RimI-like enzyme
MGKKTAKPRSKGRDFVADYISAEAEPGPASPLDVKYNLDLSSESVTSLLQSKGQLSFVATPKPKVEAATDDSWMDAAPPALSAKQSKKRSAAAPGGASSAQAAPVESTWLAAAQSFTTTYYESPASMPQPQLLSAVWSLFLANMEDLYKQNGKFGDADKAEKVSELFDRTASRYLCIHDAEGSLVAFVHFRVCFDMDADDDDDDDDDDGVGGDVQPSPCLYIYEIQVAASCAGCGLGRRLMTAAELIAASLPAEEVEKVSLTVFKANLSALRFYNKIGFGVDQEVDPSYCDAVEGEPFGDENYFILSKRVAGSARAAFDQAKLGAFLERYKLVK